MARWPNEPRRRLLDIIETAIVNWDPRSRRRAAIRLLVYTFAAAHINLAAYLLGWISVALMVAITLYLSWLAVTITCADIVATTDVRTEVDN